MIPVTKDLISQIVFYETDKNSVPELDQNPEKLTNKMLGQIYSIFSNHNSNAVNIDLFDLATILKCSGNALLGLTEGRDPNRALFAITKALQRTESQIKETTQSQMALLSIVSGKNAELEMDELTLMTEYMQKNLGDQTEVIFGYSESSKLDNEIQVMVVVAAQLSKIIV